MSVPFSNTKLRVPRGFQNLLEGLAKEVLRKQPDNIHAFAAIYFNNLLKIREEKGVDPAEIGAKNEDRFYNNRAFSKDGNVGDTSDPQQQEAATTIQSAVRGQQTRDALEAERASEEAAATRIQATYRGDGQPDGERNDTLGTEAQPGVGETDVDLDDPELDRAAIKIQATFRGFKSRQTTNNKDAPTISSESPGESAATEEEPPAESLQTTEGDKPVEEEEIDIDLDDPEVAKAALKIQGGFRVHKAKKQVEEMRKERDDDAGKAGGGGETETGDNEDLKTEEEIDQSVVLAEKEMDIDLNDPEVNRAATKIQASFRGHQERKTLKEKKEAVRDGDATTEERESKDEEELKVETAAAEEKPEEGDADETEADPDAAKDEGALQSGGEEETPGGAPTEEEAEEVPDDAVAMQQEDEEVMDIDLDDPEVNKAALKIQAGFKGMMTRKLAKSGGGTDELEPDASQVQPPAEDASEKAAHDEEPASAPDEGDLPAARQGEGDPATAADGAPEDPRPEVDGTADDPADDTV